MILKEDFYSGCTFLDNAATTLKPKVVVSEYIDYFYKKPDVEKVRDRVAKFIGTDSSKIIRFNLYRVVSNSNVK